MPASPYNPSGPEHLKMWLGNLDEPTFVYVIQGDPDTPIKVGFARDVEARIASLQTGNPQRLRLLYVLPGNQRLEWYLHQRLKGARLKGEWFNPGPTVDAFLRYVAELAEHMVSTWDGSDEAPYWDDIESIHMALPASKRRHPVTVRFVEPDPVIPREEAEALRERFRDAPMCYRERPNVWASSRIAPKNPGWGAGPKNT